MVYNYNDSKIFYKFYHGKSRSPTILLHGWGCDSSIFKNLVDSFPSRSFLVIDFPPFGKSEKEIKDWNIFTYVGMLMSLCEHLDIESCDLIGHSFGGRIAIILSAVKCSFVHSCILLGSAGMKPKRTLSYHIKVIKYKLYRRLGKSTALMGSSDYLALSPNMKKIFVSIVSTYLEQYSKKMSCPCLLIWGEKDKETPVYMARRLKRNIKNSKLCIVKDAGHYVFLDKPLKVYSEIENFWEGNG